MKEYREKLEKILPSRISDEAKTLADRYGYLPYMIERYLRMFGKIETLELLEVNEIPLPETIRCNDYLISCRRLKERLEEKGFVLYPLAFSPHGYSIEGGQVSIGATHEYLSGYYYIQDPASMLPVYELNVRPGDLILDMAAAPGGKASQILQLTKDSARLVAVDISRRRMRALRSNLSRMGFSSFILLRGDSRFLVFKNLFEKVLLDAPSTGEGIIRKDPLRKRSRSPNDLIEVSILQFEMLKAAINYLRPGGILVYAACTLAVEEGEFVISTMLDKREDLQTLSLNIPHVKGFEEYGRTRFNEQVTNCGRLLPYIHGTEGFFVCKIKKKEE